MHLRKSLSQSLKKSVRKFKVALQMKKAKNEVGSINNKRDINDSAWLDPIATSQDNRIENWWKTEEERIMKELRNIGKTDSIVLFS